MKFACLMLGFSTVAAFAADIAAEKTASAVRFAIGGNWICDYQMQPGELPEGVAASFAHGAHLYPIYSPSGKVVTGNHQPDHPFRGFGVFRGPNGRVGHELPRAPRAGSSGFAER
jgi:hypothetical protein